MLFAAITRSFSYFIYLHLTFSVSSKIPSLFPQSIFFHFFFPFVSFSLSLPVQHILSFPSSIFHPTLLLPLVFSHSFLFFIPLSLSYLLPSPTSLPFPSPVLSLFTLFSLIINLSASYKTYFPSSFHNFFPFCCLPLPFSPHVAISIPFNCSFPFLLRALPSVPPCSFLPLPLGAPRAFHLFRKQ